MRGYIVIDCGCYSNRYTFVIGLNPYDLNRTFTEISFLYNVRNICRHSYFLSKVSFNKGYRTKYILGINVYSSLRDHSSQGGWLLRKNGGECQFLNVYLLLSSALGLKQNTHNYNV